MSMHEVAKHLSAMGRHGDTTLVHMSPQEVSALHGIAALHGTHLTHNPHTGLPEAFSLGGFFKSLLPTLAGGAATALTGGALAPVLAGAVTGAALNRDNPLMGAFSGGFGGYGGMGIADALKSAAGAGASAVPQAAGAGISNQAATTGEIVANAAPGAGAGQAPMSAMPGLPGGASPSTLAANLDAARGTTGDLAATAQQFGGSTGATTAAMQPNASGLASLSQGAQNLGTSAGRDAFVKSLGGTGPNADLIAAGKVGMPLVMAGLSGIEPPQPPEEEKYKGLYLNRDSGLRLFADGGPVYEMADPGSDPTEYESGKYGLPMLNKYAGGMAGYAKGGYLDGPGDGMSDSIPATIEGKQPARLADGEFIVPADVVSHLGNGSTKAGAERLYGMLDKVRKARTGTTQQGKQINPKKYLPA
jgi:hypothetical protein